MPRNGVDRAARRMIGSKSVGPLFVYPESRFPLFLHCRQAVQRGIHSFARNKCSFVFPGPCQWDTFSLDAKGKTPLKPLRILNSASRCFICRYFEGKGTSESTCMFQESLLKLWQKRPKTTHLLCDWYGMNFLNELTWKWIIDFAVFSKSKILEAHT